MAYYYVKNGGTATGDAGRYASQQTGSFATLGAAGYYNDIAAAIAATTSPIADDFINPSDLHVFATGASINITGIATNNFFIVCVDDANIDQSRVSGRGSENSTGVSDIINVNTFYSGIELISGDNISFAGMNVLQDCEMNVTGSGDVAVFMSGDGSSANLINCVVGGNNTGSIPFSLTSGADVRMTGGSVVTPTAGMTTLTNGGFANGGGAMHFNGVDITGVTGTLIANIGSSATADDSIDIEFDQCELASGVSFTNETFKSMNHRALFTRCSGTSSAAEYQYHLHALGGDVDDDSAIFRNEDPAFEDSAQKISYKIVTNSDANLGNALWFNFPNERWAELSTAANTVTVYLTSDDVITDKDLYIEVTYPNETNKQTPTFLSSAPVTIGGTLDFMATPTTLALDTISTYTGGLTNKYKISLQLANGADTVPSIKVYCTKSGSTVQLNSIVEMS